MTNGTACDNIIDTARAAGMYLCGAVTETGTMCEGAHFTVRPFSLPAAGGRR